MTKQILDQQLTLWQKELETAKSPSQRTKAENAIKRLKKMIQNYSKTV